MFKSAAFVFYVIVSFSLAQEKGAPEEKDINCFHSDAIKYMERNLFNEKNTKVDANEYRKELTEEIVPKILAYVKWVKDESMEWMDPPKVEDVKLYKKFYQEFKRSKRNLRKRNKMVGVKKGIRKDMSRLKDGFKENLLKPETLKICPPKIVPVPTPTLPPPNCDQVAFHQWTEWSEFGSCDKDCAEWDGENGRRKRTRQCYNICSHKTVKWEPNKGLCQPSYISAGATGHHIIVNMTDTHYEPCRICTMPNYAYWAEWSEWLILGYHCGEGTSVRSRTRKCIYPMGRRDKECPGKNEETKEFKLKPCPTGRTIPWT